MRMEQEFCFGLAKFLMLLIYPNGYIGKIIENMSVIEWEAVLKANFGDIGICDIRIIFSYVPGQIEYRLGMDKEEHKWNLGYFKSFEVKGS